MSDELFHSAVLDVNRTVWTSGIPGTFAEFDGWLVADSATGIDNLNHAMVSDANKAARSFESIGRWFTERGAGFYLVLRIPGNEAMLELAKARGYLVTRSQPLMAAKMPLLAYALPRGVTVVSVRDPGHTRDYLSVRGAGPGRPPNDDEAVVIATLIATGKLGYFVAMEDGVAIATSSSAIAGAAVSVSNVWVAEAARKRGIGAAMTAIAAGFHPDADWAILEASAMGEPVYRRMGFAERFRYVRLSSRPATVEA